MKQALALVLLLAGCDLPRDPDGTSERIAAGKVIRIGLGAPLSPDAPPIAALARRLAQDTGARPRFFRDAAEPLLAQLEQDRLALVIAPFAAKTPWETRVALADPLDAAKPDDRAVTLRPAMRAGENRWIMTVERAVREVRAE